MHAHRGVLALTLCESVLAGTAAQALRVPLSDVDIAGTELTRVVAQQHRPGARPITAEAPAATQMPDTTAVMSFGRYINVIDE